MTSSLTPEQRWHRDQLRPAAERGRIGAKVSLRELEEADVCRNADGPESPAEPTPQLFVRPVQREEAPSNNLDPQAWKRHAERRAVAAERTQPVVAGDDRPLPEHLQPDARRDRPAPRVQVQWARREAVQAPQRVDRAAVNAGVSIAALVASAGLVRGRGGQYTCPGCGKVKLNVDPRRNTAHCYGAGCDVKSVTPVDWVMRTQGLGFLDAVALLTGEPRRGRELPAVQPLEIIAPTEPEPQVQQRDLHALYLAAKNAFWAQETPVAQQAMEYMLSRGFSGDELETMGIGVADSTVPDELLPLNAGGQVSQAWRNRVIIPTLEGDVAVNLKARALAPGSPEFKYLAPTGGKATLIGLEALGGQVPDGVLLVEGELDYWSARFLCPDRPVVAVRGLNNLSPAQAQLFAGRKVHVLTDDDTRLHRTHAGGDLEGLSDAEVEARLTAEGLKFGACLSARRLVRKLVDAGADVRVCATDCTGDLNDLLAHLDRTDARQIIREAIWRGKRLAKARRGRQTIC